MSYKGDVYYLNDKRETSYWIINFLYPTFHYNVNIINFSVKFLKIKNMISNYCMIKN